MSKPLHADPLFGAEVRDPSRQRRALVRWALNDWPYVTMMLLAVGGVSWATFTDHPAAAYWVFMVPVFAAICVAEGWRHCGAPAERLRLVFTQALGWAAVLVAMFLIELPDVRAVINDNASGLELLTLLALGTFVAGLQSRVWRISAVGAFLALSVPAIAWLDQSALFLTAAALLLIAIGIVARWLSSGSS
jgi:hypothetical protein